jgi:acetyl esterase/lipase
MNVRRHSVVGISSILTCLVVASPGRADDAKPATGAPAVAPKPTAANVAYGKHPKQVVDFYRAESRTPTPVVIFIHGGGWRRGSKDRAVMEPYLRAGVSVVAVEYRFIAEATKDGLEPPVQGPLHDAARAIQFVRSKAAEWNLDKNRLGATGSSAGACSSLWLAFHDDLADPKSEDPIARESTRLQCAAVYGAQTTLDPEQMKQWTPNSKYGGHAFGFAADNDKKLSEFEVFLAGREKILPWIKEYSPYELVTSDDPPVVLFYQAPPKMGQEQKDPTHTANFGLGLKEKCDKAGVECRLVYREATHIESPAIAESLIAKLKSPE